MSPHILCIGEALVEMIRCELDEPHQVPGLYEGPFPSGAPAIFAATAGRLVKGLDVSSGFIGAVGDDVLGESFIDGLAARGVAVDQVARLDGQSTSISFVQMNSDGSRSFVFTRGAAGAVEPDMLRAETFANVRGLHISGSSLSLDARLRESCYRSLELALAANPDCLVTFDPNFRIEMADHAEAIAWAQPVLERTSYLLPSGDEIEFLTGGGGASAENSGGDQQDTSAADQDIENRCRSLLQQYGIGRGQGRMQGIVLKRAERGCMLLSADEASQPVYVPAFSARPQYPTGAGDNFGGALLTCLLAGYKLADAARYACAAGSLAIEQKGLLKDYTWDDVQRRAGEEVRK